MSRPRPPQSSRSTTKPSVRTSHTLTVPRWAALALGPLVFLGVIPLIHGVVPWGMSLLAHRHGWVDGRPAPWNFLGLLPVAAGAVVLVWLLVLGMGLGSELPARVALDWSPKVFLTRGPYAVSRHPMYLAEIGLWLGWSILFGSVAVLLGCLLVCIGVGLIAPREELALESKFGAAYRQYQATVPRWLGHW